MRDIFSDKPCAVVTMIFLNFCQAPWQRYNSAMTALSLTLSRCPSKWQWQNVAWRFCRAPVCVKSHALSWRCYGAHQSNSDKALNRTKRGKEKAIWDSFYLLKEEEKKMEWRGVGVGGWEMSIILICLRWALW